MPKIIELTVEIAVQSVSCPGVWLCQDGRVSLTVFTLGTSYQTCLLPPVFPLLYRDHFYFRKRYQETCALNNICCLMKDETIYCELVQWSESCGASKPCTILAQYLGSLNEMLFPSNTCFNDGVDLLMRRCKDFPGILSPKIEVSTKVRIDEVCRPASVCAPPARPAYCACGSSPEAQRRQKQVCHSPVFHKHRCQNEMKRPRSAPRDRPRSVDSYAGSTSSKIGHPCSYGVYTVRTPDMSQLWNDVTQGRNPTLGQYSRQGQNGKPLAKGRFSLEDQMYEDETIGQTISTLEQSKRANECSKVILESRYIQQELESQSKAQLVGRHYSKQVTPCVCEICQRYHELFHADGWTDRD